MGPMKMDAGFTPLIRHRLVEQILGMKPIETYTSLIFDEMAIKPMSIYLRQHRRVFGSVNYGNYRKYLRERPGVIANRLLCFVLKGIFTNYTIPVSYFFVRQLKAEDLVVMIRNILKELEAIGFRVTRLVGDDL